MAKRLLEIDREFLQAQSVIEAIAQDTPPDGLADFFLEVDDRLHRERSMAHDANDGNDLGVSPQIGRAE
jgi:hypothetical protein